MNEQWCLQRFTASAVVDEAVTVLEDAVDQLPSTSQLKTSASMVVDAVEEVVSPEHLAAKRLKRKQKKARCDSTE